MLLCTARPPAAFTSASGHTNTQVAHRRAQVPGAIVVCVVRHQQHAQRQLVWQVQQGEGAVVVVQLQRRHPQGLQAGRRGRQAGGASIVKGLVPAAWKPACPACCVASRLASLDPCLSRLGQPAPAAVHPPPPPPQWAACKRSIWMQNKVRRACTTCATAWLKTEKKASSSSSLQQAKQQGWGWRVTRQVQLLGADWSDGGLVGQTEEGPATLHPRCGGGGDVCVGDVVGWGEGVGVRVCGGGVRLYGVGWVGGEGGGGGATITSPPPCQPTHHHAHGNNTTPTWHAGRWCRACGCGTRRCPEAGKRRWPSEPFTAAPPEPAPLPAGAAVA